jgi:hypothetical protein
MQNEMGLEYFVTYSSIVFQEHAFQDSQIYALKKTNWAFSVDLAEMGTRLKTQSFGGWGSSCTKERNWDYESFHFISDRKRQ